MGGGILFENEAVEAVAATPTANANTTSSASASPSAPSSSLNTTPLRELVRRGQRVVAFVGEWAAVTNRSARALDGCLVDNQLLPSVFEGVSTDDDVTPVHAHADAMHATATAAKVSETETERETT